MDSYTDFSVYDIAVSGTLGVKVDDKIVVTARIDNVGRRTGSQILQVYLSPPQVAGLERLVKTLVGF